ncbi:MAG: HAD-IA family hydrolase [Clostridia bacterium]|nr:HAD-IA family hydrolase [Clostridia bacterium]
MKNYQWIFFDLDGTLTDSANGIINSVEYSLTKFGIFNTDREKLFSFIGPPLVDAYMSVFGFSQEKAELAVKYYREYYPDHGLLDNSVYAGVEDALKTLNEAGKTLIIATAKPEPFANRVLEHFDLLKYFKAVAGAQFGGPRIKKSQVIEYAFTLDNITDKSKVVMVGDRENDVSGAKKNGIDSIGVLYGYGSIEELTEAGATYIANTPEDICKIILKENG